MARRHGSRSGDLQSLFGRLEELVLANSGADEFEEAFKLVVAKLWDEKTERGPRFRVCDSEESTYQQVTQLLREAEQAWPGILDPPCQPQLTPSHLQVCVEALSTHRLADQSLEIMDGFFEFLVSKGAKGAKGQYFTPRHVVEFCVRMLQPTADETVCDPACGSGGFLIHALNHVRGETGLPTPEALKSYCRTKVWGFDLDLRATRVAKALMVLAGDGSANIIRLNTLLLPGSNNLFSEVREDGSSILTVEDITRSRLRHHKGFDVILTNPPFAGEVRERHILDGYTLGRGRPRVERDVLFVERCVGLLRPGGRMAIVLPHNKVASEACGNLRELLFKRTRVLAVVGLGRHTFLPHTHQKTSVVFVQKNELPTRAASNYPIFFAISERDGKNSKGQLLLRGDVELDAVAWQRVDHDLSEIVPQFREFYASNVAAC